MNETDIQRSNSPTNSSKSPQSNSSNELSNGDGDPPPPSTDNKKEQEMSPRPLKIYTRSQLLRLLESPLVKVPEGMPALRSWFGEVDYGRKEPEPSTSNTARDRRFRHGGTEDGDTPPRASFRSSQSQPSQMGNFKHQSIRSTDRDRDRGDADKERDLRDKEGQERLRSLSDKYDRERMVLPTNLPGIRTKERDAPSTLPNGSGRNASQTQPGTGAGRQPELRNPSKKKAGEATDDWRRGDLPCVRADRTENGRKERGEDREQPRSRGGENNSRNKRDVSLPKRERDDLKGDDRRAPRRDGDKERDNEQDDPRRWRDDGKRDERVAARTDKEKEREERDSRSKRGARRLDDDTKEKEDRREREKEREPAWMDAYVPSPTGESMLSGKGADGELDGIQAFKKGMKEKERKEKGIEGESAEVQEALPLAPAIKAGASEKPLDEIQMFRMMMKREEDRKNGADKLDVSLGDEAPLASSTPNNDPSGTKQLPLINGEIHTFDATHSSQFHNLTANGALKPVPDATKAASSDPTSLLSLLEAPGQSSSVSLSNNSSTSTLSTKPPTSRLFPQPLGSEPQPNTALINDQISPEPSPSSTATQFNPPPGSRVLAFGNRSAPAAKPAPPSDSLSSATQALNELSLAQHFNLQNSQRQLFKQPPGNQLDSESSVKPSLFKVVDTSRPIQFEERSLITPENRDVGFMQSPVGMRRSSASPRGQTSTYSDQGYNNQLSHPQTSLVSDSLGSPNGSGSMSAKGSRFAKFFDGKTRDGPPGAIKGFASSGLGSVSSPGLVHGQDQGGFGSDNRTMDDIFAMLNSSAQGPKVTGLGQNNVRQIPSGHQLGHHSVHPLQPQQQLHSHIPQQSVNRQESLYDSRLEDRNFVPDGLVPGLRTSTVPQRNRDPLGGMFSDSIDDHVMQFNGQQQHQRLAQQQRGLEQMFSSGGPVPNHFGGQVGIAGRSIHSQQTHFRGGPSPIQNLQQIPLQQRLPPGLANLGGRPPHEPTQFVNLAGLNSVGPGGPLLGNGIQYQHQHQQPYTYSSNSISGAGLNFGGPQLRGLPHQMQGQISGMSHGIDQRGAANQAQLLALTNGLRAGGSGSFSVQNAGQMQLPPHTMRHQPQPQQQPLQQQARHIPPHMVSHLLPPHLHQPPASSNQPAHDLMALLMGGSHNRE